MNAIADMMWSKMREATRCGKRLIRSNTRQVLHTCQLPKGHTGMHACIETSALVPGLIWRSEWDDGYDPGPGVEYLKAGVGMISG